MKFNRKFIENFNLEASPNRDPVNIMQIKDMLAFMKNCAERIKQKGDLYINTPDANIQADCLDIVTAKLNDFTQVFKDLVIFMKKNDNTYKGNNSLRYCMASYDTFGFDQTWAEKLFLKELQLRNEITHDYFNRDIHQQKLIWIIKNCRSGALDIYYNIFSYCEANNLLEKYANNSGK